MTKRRYIIQAALTGALLLVFAADLTTANESNWPQFRGPNCSGLAAEGQNPPVEFDPDHKVLWKIPILSGHSSACIWSNSIFLTGYDEEKKKLHVFCIDRDSGRIRWDQTVHSEQIEQVHPVGSPAAATPAADGERVYVYFGSVGLLSYDFAGKQQWIVPLAIPETTTEGHGTSPIVSGDLVILNGGEPNEPSAFLLAVGRKTGQIVWKQALSLMPELGATSHATPVLWKEQLILHLGGELAAYKAADGTLVWSVPINTKGTSTPVVEDDVFFVGAWTNLGEPDLRVKLPDFEKLAAQYDKDGDGQISRSEFPDDMAIARRPDIANVERAQFYIKPSFDMIDSNKDGVLDEAEWKMIFDFLSSADSPFFKDHGLTAIKVGGSSDVAATHVLWQEKINAPEVPSPLYYDGRIYAVKNGGLVCCIDAVSGKLLYRERLGAGGLYCSSPICAGGRIYISSTKGIVAVLAAGDKFQLLARNDLKEPIYATPAVVDNKLYVRTTKHLYAFGE